jgi:hypothetical protein
MEARGEGRKNRADNVLRTFALITGEGSISAKVNALVSSAKFRGEGSVEEKRSRSRVSRRRDASFRCPLQTKVRWER